MKTANLILAVMLTLGPCLQMHAQSTEPSAWRWGAQLDETVFEPRGEAVIIHVDVTAPAGGDGSAAAPFNSMAPAVERAVARRSLLSEEDRDPVGKLELPVWLRLVRRGNRLTAASAPDVDGRPGAWEERASAEVPMTGQDYLGFYTQAHGELVAESVLSHVTMNGQTAMEWQLAKIGTVSGEFTVEGNAIKLKGTGKSNRWFDENYAFLHLPVAGDVELVARMDAVHSYEARGRFMVGMLLRDKLTRSPRLFELSAQKLTRDPEFGTYIRRPAREGGKDVKIAVKPGVYRFDECLKIAFDEEAADQGTLIIEGDGPEGSVMPWWDQQRVTRDLASVPLRAWCDLTSDEFEVPQ